MLCYCNLPLCVEWSAASHHNRILSWVVRCAPLLCKESPYLPCSVLSLLRRNHTLRGCSKPGGASEIHGWFWHRDGAFYIHIFFHASRMLKCPISAVVAKESGGCLDRSSYLCQEFNFLLLLHFIANQEQII